MVMNEKITEILDEFLKVNDASHILKALLQTWAQYLLTIDGELPDNFKELSIDMHVLIMLVAMIAKEQRKEQDTINDDLQNTINQKINGHTKTDN